MSLPHSMQHTVALPADARGVGLHTGRTVRLRLSAADPDEGVSFIRTDLPGRPRIMASPDSVRREALTRRTELAGEAGATVATTEHFLAAALALGLDNVRVELDGPELPIFDGSAQPFVDLIRRAGLATQNRERRLWRLRRPVALTTERADIVAVPAEQMDLVFIAELRHAAMANQTAAVTVTAESFIHALAPARTFCFYEEVEQLRAAGLIKGGSLDCAIVLRQGKPVDGEYRLPNELACHKMVDLIGDLALLGRPLAALVTAHGTGHALHFDFIQQLRKELTLDV